MARTKTASKPAVTALDVTHSLAKAKPATCGDAHGVLVTLYGEAVADQFSSKGCRRLPRHEVTAEKGHKAEKPRGLMTPAERKRIDSKRVAKAASKVVTRMVTIAGTKFRVPLDKAGQPLLAKATPVIGPVAK